MENSFKKVCPTTMRAGWTLIELILIMVIIGILASIAVKRFSVTRDDAKLSAIVSNMAVCIRDATNHYTTTHQDYTLSDHSFACDVNNTQCYDITYSIHGIDFNVTMNFTRESYCADIEDIGGHLAKSYDFGGKSVTR